YCSFRCSSSSAARRTARARSATGVWAQRTWARDARSSLDSISAAPRAGNSRIASPVAGFIVRIAISLGTLVRPDRSRCVTGDPPSPPRRAMLAIEERLHGVAPRILHRDRIRKSLAGIRRETPAKPIAHLGRIAVEVDVAAELAGENHSAIRFPEGCLTAQRECDNGRERKAIDRGILLLTQQLLGCGKRWRPASAGTLFSRCLGDSEVGNAPPAIPIDENVLRFEIAVHDPDRVRGSEAAEHEVDLRRDLGECPRTG